MGPVFSVAGMAWGVYSTVTSIVEVPGKAQDFAKLLADPPANLQWWFLAVFIGVTIWGFWPTGPEVAAPERASQSSSGPNSVNIGVNHGPVTLPSPPPAATQPAKSPYGSGSPPARAVPRPPMTISRDAMRAAEGLPPLRPDYELVDVVMLAQGRLPNTASQRDINLLIADWIVEHKVKVWGRREDLPIHQLSSSELRFVKIDCANRRISTSDDWGHRSHYSDVKFSSVEVGEYWN